MDTRLEHIGTVRRALQHTTRRPRRWAWGLVVMVVLVNLGLSMGVILTKDQRLAEVEHRLELAMQGRGRMARGVGHGPERPGNGGGEPARHPDRAAW